MDRPNVWVHVHDVHPDHVGVQASSWPGEVCVYLGSLLWRGRPEEIRAVVAEIDCRLPVRSDSDAALARFDTWQGKGLGTVDSLRLATGAA